MAEDLNLFDWGESERADTQQTQAAPAAATAPVAPTTPAAATATVNTATETPGAATSTAAPAATEAATEASADGESENQTVLGIYDTTRPHPGPKPTYVERYTPFTGYNDIVNHLQTEAEKSKAMTEEERRKEARREASHRIIGSITDVIGRLAQLYGASKGVPQSGAFSSGISEAAQNRYRMKLELDEKAKAQRLNLLMQAAGLRERQHTAVQEALQRNRADYRADVAEWRQDNDAYYKDQQRGEDKAIEIYKHDTTIDQRDRTNASRENTARIRGASRGSSRRVSSAKPGEFPAWDKNGNMQIFRSKDAADRFARRNGTLGVSYVVTESTEHGITRRTTKPVYEPANPNDIPAGVTLVKDTAK